MADNWFSCSPCVGSDPTQDTVKVDPNLLNKENIQPFQAAQKKEEEEAQRQREAEEQRMVEERRKQAEEEEERLRVEKQKAAEAKAQQEADEKARQEAEEKARLDAQEKARQEEAARAAAEEERLRQEAQKAAEEQATREREEMSAAQEKVSEWCKANGFQDIYTAKKTIRRATKLPIHTAVKHQNDEMVGLLLKCGAAKDAEDSKKQTPMQLAEKMNKNGSHDNIMAMLR